MSNELRQIISGYGGDPDKWDFFEDEASFEGESTDGVPSWDIREDVCGGFVVRRELGWHAQQGDADCVEDAIKLMNAMDVAHKALQEVMSP